jgi:twinkle protein
MKDTDSTFIGHFPCPSCGSSDAYAEYSDGHGYCFACCKYFHSEDKKMESPKKEAKGLIPISELSFSALNARGINKDTCQKLKYYVGYYNDKPCQVACYYDLQGNLVGQKLRFPDKTFSIRGKISDCLFGSQLWESGKKIVITEGEIDALTVSQLQGNQWPVVSIPNGAQAAKKAIEANLEYLSKFDQIILMFDMDEPGRKAVEEQSFALLYPQPILRPTKMGCG